MGNGTMGLGELTPIGGGVVGSFSGSGQLANGVAPSWNAMRNAIHDRDGVWIMVTGPSSAYRNLAMQQYFWNLYQSGQGNLAAYPGTSNHGFGTTVDVPAYTRSAIDRHGAAFGWAKAWSDAPSEWWHLRYAPGHWNGQDPGSGGGGQPTYPTLKRGDRGGAVKRAQKHLRRWNLGLTRPQADGDFGDKTKNAVKDFQRVHDLRPDGVIGDKTWARLRRKDHFKDDERSHINRIKAKRYRGEINPKERKQIRFHRDWCGKRARSILDAVKATGWDEQHRKERFAILRKMAGAQWKNP
jgi:Putative peptidoglycan binding domain/D-alanyl-D-alanine carboxypeptidase